jgi:hypothetical protein
LKVVDDEVGGLIGRAGLDVETVCADITFARADWVGAVAQIDDRSTL